MYGYIQVYTCTRGRIGTDCPTLPLCLYSSPRKPYYEDFLSSQSVCLRLRSATLQGPPPRRALYSACLGYIFIYTPTRLVYILTHAARYERRAVTAISTMIYYLSDEYWSFTIWRPDTRSDRLSQRREQIVSQYELILTLDSSKLDPPERKLERFHWRSSYRVDLGRNDWSILYPLTLSKNIIRTRAHLGIYLYNEGKTLPNFFLSTLWNDFSKV